MPFSSEMIGVHACVGAFERASFARDGSFVACLQNHRRKTVEKHECYGKFVDRSRSISPDEWQHPNENSGRLSCSPSSRVTSPVAASTDPFFLRADLGQEWGGYHPRRLHPGTKPACLVEMPSSQKFSRPQVGYIAPHAPALPSQVESQAT